MDKEKQRIKKIAEYKTVLEERIQELKKELEALQFILELADSTLLKESFKRVEIEKQKLALSEKKVHLQFPSSIKPQKPEIVEPEKKVPIKTVEGELLANLYVYEDSLRVVLAEDKQFNINTPPFTSFLIERVLTKMQKTDREAAKMGQIIPEKILSYNIISDGDIIHEITVHNISPKRLQELRSTIRWTIEKMYEKTTKTNP